MGYNSTVVVLNDALNDIQNDPQFGKNLVAAILGLSLGDDPRTGKPCRPRDIPAGMYCNAATVVEQHHASGNAIIAVGGNYGTVIGHAGNGGAHHDRLSILKELANQLGYSLRKKGK